MLFRILFIAVLCVSLTSGFCGTPPIDSAATRLEQLRQKMQTVVSDYEGLAAGVALIRTGQPDYIVGLGTTRGRPATANTVFLLLPASLRLHTGSNLVLKILHPPKKKSC